MSLPRMLALALVVLPGGAFRAGALDRPKVTFKVFQFSADKIPRIDGNTNDRTMVPAVEVPTASLGARRGAT